MITEKQMAHGVDWQGENITGYILVEKYDGVRAYWDGQRFWSRSGRIIEAPDYIIATMPPEHADCEIWAGRGGFARASAAARLGGRHWSGVVVKVFDYPQRPGDWMQRNGGTGIVCENNRHAIAMMREVITNGGEGLVARKPGIKYAPGRSNAILKLKEGK